MIPPERVAGYAAVGPIRNFTIPPLSRVALIKATGRLFALYIASATFDKPDAVVHIEFKGGGTVISIPIYVKGYYLTGGLATANVVVTQYDDYNREYTINFFPFGQLPVFKGEAVAEFENLTPYPIVVKAAYAAFICIDEPCTAEQI